MEVKTIKPHSNPRGAAFQKQEGDVYHLPEHEATGLIAAGLVEPLAESPKAARRNGKPRQD